MSCLSLSLKFVLIPITESPAQFFSENKNIPRFDNVSFLLPMFHLSSVDPKYFLSFYCKSITSQKR